MGHESKTVVAIKAAAQAARSAGETAIADRLEVILKRLVAREASTLSYLSQILERPPKGS